MEIINLLKEPFFYVATGIGSLLLSIVGNLITPFFQNKISLFYRSRNERRIKEYLGNRDAVNKLHISCDDRGEVKIDAILGFLHAIVFMMIGIVVLLVGSMLGKFGYVFLFFGFLILYYGTKVIDAQNFQLSRLRTAVERENALLKCMDENNVAPSEQTKQDAFLLNWDAKRFNVTEEELLEHIRINRNNS